MPVLRPTRKPTGGFRKNKRFRTNDMCIHQSCIERCRNCPGGNLQRWHQTPADHTSAAPTVRLTLSSCCQISKKNAVSISATSEGELSRSCLMPGTYMPRSQTIARKGTPWIPWMWNSLAHVTLVEGTTYHILRNVTKATFRSHRNMILHSQLLSRSASNDEPSNNDQ